jgi:CheY-like chemotaxis protein
MLERHRAVPCGSALEALALATATAFDVILCDVTMPERGGLELLADLRAHAPATAERVILMSGAALDADATALRAARPTHWLDKPFSRLQLEEAIARVVGDG